MTMKDLLARLRTRREPKVEARDWTNSWTPRDWADLPTPHPRRDDGVA